MESILLKLTREVLLDEPKGVLVIKEAPSGVNVLVILKSNPTELVTMFVVPDKTYVESPEMVLIVVLGSIDASPHEKTLEFVAADDNPASQSIELDVLPEEEHKIRIR